MDIQTKFTLASLTISLSEDEAVAALADPRALQASIRAALHPDASKRTARNGHKPARRPKASATLTCTTCGQVFKRHKNYDRHMLKHTAEPVAAT